jgi:hypothetical protein
MEWFIAQHRIRPQLHVSSDDGHEERLSVLAHRLGRDPDSLLKQALEYLLGEYEAKHFGSLSATQPSPDGEQPLVHARTLSESVAKPLCGATDGPWSARLFDFGRLTCHECQFLVLHPDDDPS